MKCSTCGQEMPVKVGDIVEVTTPELLNSYYWHGLAIVYREADLSKEAAVTMITGKQKGQTNTFHMSRLRVVHGHIHIDRVGKSTPCSAGFGDDHLF